MFRRLWKGKSGVKKPGGRDPSGRRSAIGRSPAKSSAESPTGKKPAKKVPSTKAPAAKKTTRTTKTTTAKKSAAKETRKTRKKAPAKIKKTSTQKKSATNKAAASKKKASAKRKPARKKAGSAKKKTAPKKASTAKTIKKKAAPKKALVKKSASKRPAANRKVAKPAAKKSATKKSIQKTVLSSRSGHRLAPQVKPPFEAYKGEKPYIFTSYAHRNMQEVFGIMRKLNESRYRVWYDEGIEPGNEWPEIVGRAVLRCSQFLVFMSQAAAKSRNVRNEINLAFSEDKEILVVFLEKTNLSEGMRLQIGTVQFINKFEMKESEFVDKLKKVLGSDLRN